MSQLFYVNDEDGWNQYYILAEDIARAVLAYKDKLGFLPSNVKSLDMEFIDFIDATNRQQPKSKSELKRLAIQNPATDRDDGR
jgi:hypothetical protein